MLTPFAVADCVCRVQGRCGERDYINDRLGQMAANLRAELQTITLHHASLLMLSNSPGEEDDAAVAEERENVTELKVKEVQRATIVQKPLRKKYSKV